MPRTIPLCNRYARPLVVAVSLATVLGAESYAVEVASPPMWAPAPAHPYEVRGSQQRLLDRFERFLDRQQWDDALDLAAQLVESDDQTVVAVGGHRYVSLRAYCHRRLAQLPAAPLAQYRRLVDAPAKAWYRQGIAERNEQLLRRIVDEMFCSSWGDDALDALGELALERGEYHTARTYWSRISSKLGEVDLLTYPDTDLSLADVGTRLALTSLREGDLQRAESEMETLFIKYGDARGRLAGSDVVYSEALAGLLQQARTWPKRQASPDWPTFAGSNSRTNFSSDSLSPPLEKLWSHSISDLNNDHLATFPIVVGDLLIYQTASRLQALQLSTGQPAFESQALTFQSLNHEDSFLGAVRYTLTGSGQRVYGAATWPIGGQVVRESQSNPAGIWGVDLERDGALSFREQPEDDSAAFAGAPIVVGTRLFAALRANDRTARTGIACFDLATRTLSWQCWLCQANTPATGWTGEVAGSLLTYDAGVVYSCTNLGAVAAVRADDGHVLWLTMYDRTSEPLDESGKHPFYRGPNPGIFERGTLFVLPTDGRELLALDAATGSVRWRSEMSDPFSQLVGVAERSLVVADGGFRALDLENGEILAAEEGLPLFGQAVIAGTTVYWPVDQAIHMIDIATGEVAETSIPLPESGGANLLVADNYLVAATASQITVFQSQAENEPEAQASQVP